MTDSSRPRMACPACARRYGQCVAAGCPVCDGDGLLVFGRKAEAAGPPVVTASAVACVLEAVARRRLAADHTAGGIAAARDALAGAVAALRRHGLIAPRATAEGRGDGPVDLLDLLPDDATPPADHGPIGGMELVMFVLDASDGRASLLDAPPLRFTRWDRPLEHGGIPAFSSNGHMSYLARVCDPIDPADIDDGSTMRRESERASIEHQAEVLARVVLDGLQVIPPVRSRQEG